MKTFRTFRFILFIVMTMVGLNSFGQGEATLTFTPAGSLYFDASGGEQDVLVTTENVSSWEISSVSDDSWVEATRSGDQIHVKVEPNSTGSSRRATISVSSDDLEEDKTITVIQKEPTLDIGSDNRTIPATSTNNLTCDVWSNANWKVEVTSSGNWLELVSPANGMGSGNGQIVLKPKGENTSSTARTATVKITNRDYPQQSKSYTITQLPLDIVFTLSTHSLLSNNTGEEKNFNITSNKNLTLSATDDATGVTPTWFTLGDTNFEASGGAAVYKEFKVTFDKNKSLKSRSGKITIKREGTEVAVITVTQTGTEATVISSDAVNFSSDANTKGDTYSLKVTSNVPVRIGTVDYSSTAGQENWLKITPSDAPHEDATVSTEKVFTLSVLSDNPSDNDRVAKFNLIWTDENDVQKTKQIQVVQMGGDFVFSVSTPAVQSSNTGGEQNFTVNSNKNLTLTATDDATGGTPTWFTLDNTSFEASGVAATDKPFKVTFEKNKSLKARSGKITIKKGSTEVTVITVTQNGTTADVATSTDAVNFESNAKTTGKTFALKVTSNVPVQIGTVDYSATTGQADWLNVNPLSKSHDDATVKEEKVFTLSVKSDNPSDNERVAKFNVIWTDENDRQQTKQIQVVQMGGDFIFSVSTPAVQSSNTGGEQNFTVNSNKNLTLTATDDATGGTPTWFTLDNTSFEASGVAATDKPFKVTFEKNKSLKARSGKITIKKGDSEISIITITQSGTEATVTTSTDAVNFDSNAKTTGKTFALKVTSNVPVQIGTVDYSSTAGQENWLKITPSDAPHEDATAKTEKDFTLSVLSDNPSDNERVAKFNVIWTDENDRQQTKQIQVVQMGGDFLFSCTPAVQSGNTGGEQNFTVKSNKDLTLTATDDATGGTPTWFTLDNTSFEASGVAAVEKEFKVIFEKNKSLKARSGKVTIKKGDSEISIITITQSGTEATVLPPTDHVNFNSNANTKGDTYDLKITSNVPLQIGTVDYSSTAGQENWLKITPTDATHEDATVTNEKVFTLSVLSDNPNDNERVAKFNIIWIDENDRQQTQQITVSQKSGTLNIDATFLRDDISKDGATKSITINCSVEWKIDCNVNWVKFNPKSDNGTKSVNITIDPNDSLYQRTATIFVKTVPENGGTEVTDSFLITQNGTAEVKAQSLIEFTIMEADTTVTITPNVTWRVKNGSDWLSIKEPQDTVDAKHNSIKLYASYNKDVSERTDTLYVEYLKAKDPEKWGVLKVPVEQHAYPIVPQELVVIPGNREKFEFTIGQDVDLKIDESAYVKPDGYWQYEWFVNDTIQNSNNTDFKFNSFNKKQPYKIKVKRSYNEDPNKIELQKDTTITLYPHPICPETLELKGNGKSGIWIAIFKDTTDAKLMKDCEYVFGHYDQEGNAKEVTTANPYFQYCKRDTTTKWVYTRWDIIDNNTTHTLKSIGDPCYWNNAESVGSGEVKVKGGKLIGNVATPTPAVIDIISVGGNTLRRIQLPASTTFNETIDTNGLPAGICVVKCTVGDKRIEQKMVIK